MQKKIALSLVIGTTLLTLIVLMILATRKKDTQETTLPEPTEINKQQKEGNENKKDREEWIKIMHAAAPGTDWKKMDAELRFQKMQERAEQYKLKGTRAGEWDTLANDNLIGKWNEVGPFNVAGRMRASEVDFTTNTVYAFSQGGNLWKSDLDGANWSVINDGFNVQDAIFLRKIDTILLMAANNWGTQGFYKTHDEGITWTQATGLDDVSIWGNIFDVEMLNDTAHTILLLALEWDYDAWAWNTCLYRSIDTGTTFNKIFCWDEATYGNSNKFALWTPRYGMPIAYIAAKDSLLMVDADATITTVGALPTTTGNVYMLSGFQNTTDTYLYLASANWTTNKTTFYRSADAGVSWDEKGIVNFTYFSLNSFNASQKTEGNLWYGGVNCVRSSNGGTTFSTINEWYDYYGQEATKLHADIPFIQSYLDTITNAETLLISTDGGLFKSANYGVSNTNITLVGMRNAQFYDVYTYKALPEIMYAGAQDQGYQQSIYDIGGNYYFEQIYSGDYGHLVSSDGGDNLWMNYPGFTMLAKSGTDLYTWDFLGYGNLWIPPLMADPLNPEQVWLGGGSATGDSYLYRVYYTGGGLNYEKKTYNFSAGSAGSIAAIASSELNTDYWYVMTSKGYFFYSTDAGVTWTKNSVFDGPDSHYFYGSSIVPSKTDLGTVYIGGSGYSNPAVYKSTDNGVSFTSMSDGLPYTLVYDMDILPEDSLLFAATEVGPYVYIPAENYWYDFAGLDAPYQVYWSVEYVDTIKTLRFGTHGRGIFDFKLFEEEIIEPPVAIQSIPTKDNFTVYPNPATEQLQIVSELYFPSAIISVFNASGKLVMQQQNVGLNKSVPYILLLNQLSAGVYYLEVNTGDKKSVQKFIKS
ncbi:MAG: T9SS type A sorting domain-containing protein [Bacteroidetes bacterium]|nr:T9SS type A sorting domain-containing protein [Bacteroidota bacterium]